jgi:hypothetical protein
MSVNPLKESSTYPPQNGSAAMMDYFVVNHLPPADPLPANRPIVDGEEIVLEQPHEVSPPLRN